MSDLEDLDDLGTEVVATRSGSALQTRHAVKLSRSRQMSSLQKMVIRAGKATKKKVTLAVASQPSPEAGK